MNTTSQRNIDIASALLALACLIILILIFGALEVQAQTLVTLR